MDILNHLYKYVLLLCFLVVFTPLLGTYLSKVFSGKQTLFHSLFKKLERFFYQFSNISSQNEMNWKDYTKAWLSFQCIGFITIFLFLKFQDLLPLNPEKLPSLPWFKAFNISASLITNTNWQSYSGETTLSYLSQILGMGVQNFLSASSGIAVFFAFTRGFIRSNKDTIGNFWVDLTRTVIYILLPLSFILAPFLIQSGTLHSFLPYQRIQTLENDTQVIALGPIASQVATKILSGGGGGIFRANSSHPFENPTPLSNFLGTFAMLLIPASLTYAFGLLTHSRKQGFILLFVMFTFWILSAIFSLSSLNFENPIFENRPYLEGIETRFGRVDSQLWSVTTTDTSNGSFNASMTSFPPLAAGAALYNLLIGEVIFGGIGIGLCKMLQYALLTVFVSGLIIGKSPQYLGKKIEKKEIQWVVFTILASNALILMGTSFLLLLPPSFLNVENLGPHKFTTLLYTLASTSLNNGSAFLDLNATTPFYECFLGLIMLLGKLIAVLPLLALSGLMAKQTRSFSSLKIIPINTPLFGILLIGVILITGSSIFFAAFSLGPLMEHFLMLKGQVF